MINIIRFKVLLFYLLPVFYISGPFLSDLSLSLIGLLFIYIALIQKNFFFFIKKKFSIFFLIFYSILIISSIFSFDFFISFSQILFYFRYLFFTLGVFYLFINNHIKFRTLFYFYFFALFIICFDIFFEFFFGFNLSFNQTEHYLKHRLSSFFGEELIAGSFISRFLPVLISIYILSFKENSNKYLILIITIFALFSSFLSGERTGFVLLIITFTFTLLLLNFSKKSYLVIFLSSLLTIVIINSVSPKPIESMFLKTFDQLQERSVIKFLPLSKHHEAHALSALKMFKNSPITGNGPNSFRYLCDDKKYYVDLGCTTHPHQMYIQILTETGIIGFIFMILFLFYISQQLFIILVLNFNEKNISYLVKSEFFLLLAIFINLFPFLPSNNFFNNWINVMYFLPFGLYLGVLNKKLKNE